MEEPTEAVASLTDELAWEAAALSEDPACEASELMVEAFEARSWEADETAADGLMVMAVEGRETLEGS